MLRVPFFYTFEIAIESGETLAGEAGELVTAQEWVLYEIGT